MVPPGGFLRGEQFERERVVPPLSRLLCLLSCRSKKVRPRWQALAKSRLENRRKGYNRVSIPTSKYHPQSKPELHRPLAPSVTATPCQLPPGGSYGVRTFSHWLAAMGKCLLWNPSVAFGASSLWQGSLWVRYRHRAGQGSNESQKVAVRICPRGHPGGRVREVTIR